MRVISGIYKSRKLSGYDENGIRPTMDKVKESIFAMISRDVKDSTCIDLFSGTGSMGIEAISNGANNVYFIDNSKKSIDITKYNLNNLGITNSSVIYSDYTHALKNFNEMGKTFDIIFVDPPYGIIKIKKVLDEINKYNILRENALVICEYENEVLLNNYESLSLLKEKKYGNTFVRIYINRK